MVIAGGDGGGSEWPQDQTVEAQCVPLGRTAEYSKRQVTVHFLW